MRLVLLQGGPLDLDGTFIRDNLMEVRSVDDGDFVAHEYRVAPYQYGQAVGTYAGIAKGPEHY